MKFRVEHETRYDYSAPVFLEPQTIRLCPRNDPAQRLISFELELNPRPVRQSQALGAEGNSVVHAWFEGLTDSLTVTARIQAETLRARAFDFLFLDPSHERLPISYRRDEPLLEGWLRPDDREGVEVDTWVREARRQAGDGTIAFLTTLCGMLYERLEVVIRDDGHPLTPLETISRGQGACRDLTVLYIECCRRVGFTARFVSGYQRGDDDPSERHLYAWAEVYIPGGGWRGFDPTHGLAVAADHSALAASGAPAGAAPVAGSFRGSGVTAKMRPRLEISVE